jgi:hypothetical protein
MPSKLGMLIHDARVTAIRHGHHLKKISHKDNDKIFINYECKKCFKTLYVDTTTMRGDTLTEICDLTLHLK